MYLLLKGVRLNLQHWEAYRLVSRGRETPKLWKGVYEESYKALQILNQKYTQLPQTNTKEWQS